jgi:hypothetical protein
MRYSIFDVSPSASIRFVLFSLASSAQIIFLIIAYFFVLPSVIERLNKPEEKPDEQTLRQQANDHIDKNLKSSDIEVTCKKARIVHFSNMNMTAEFTLQIKNVPAAISSYEFQIAAVGDGKSFGIGSQQLFSGGGGHVKTIRPVNVKAVNENGTWAFYQGEPPQKTRIGNDEEFTFQLDFYRENPQDTSSLPDTITPELKIRPQANVDHFSQKIFFNRPVPVSFNFTF